MESWFVQSELVIQEFQMATWAKKVIVTIPNLDGSVIFKVDKTSPQQAVFVMCSLPGHTHFQCAGIALKIT